MGLAGVPDAYKVRAEMERRGVAGDVVSFTSVMDVVAKAAARGAAGIGDAQEVLQVSPPTGRFRNAENQ